MVPEASHPRAEFEKKRWRSKGDRQDGSIHTTEGCTLIMAVSAQEDRSRAVDVADIFAPSLCESGTGDSQFGQC